MILLNLDSCWINKIHQDKINNNHQDKKRNSKTFGVSILLTLFLLLLH